MSVCANFYIDKVIAPEESRHLAMAGALQRYCKNFERTMLEGVKAIDRLKARVKGYVEQLNRENRHGARLVYTEGTTPLDYYVEVLAKTTAKELPVVARINIKLALQIMPDECQPEEGGVQ